MIRESTSASRLAPNEIQRVVIFVSYGSQPNEWGTQWESN